MWKRFKQAKLALEDNFTVAVFGECGQGKSTLLNKISQVYLINIAKENSHLIEFEASQSVKSVTSSVKIAKSGNMTLIDSPGFNDPNKERTDKAIFMDLISNLREPLKSPNEGISMFIQCIMPDKSVRIRQSVITSMMNFLLILSVFHKDTTVQDLKRCHPSMAIVFNNVSKKQSTEKFTKLIDYYKELLTDEAVKFYCDEISDETIIQGKAKPFSWKIIKNQVMNKENYQDDVWYKNAELSDYD